MCKKIRKRRNPYAYALYFHIIIPVEIAEFLCEKINENMRY